MCTITHLGDISAGILIDISSDIAADIHWSGGHIDKQALLA